MFSQCIEENDDIITPIDPGGGPSGGGGSGESTDPPPPGSNPPCTGTTIPTNPQPGFTDENGCPIGAPTLPNTPIIRGNPCEKLKNNIDTTPGLKNKLLDLNKPVNFLLDWEIGAVIQDNAQGQSGLMHKEGNAGETYINVEVSATGETTGFVHVHFEGSTMSPVFSFDDLKTFASIYQWRAYNNKPLDKLVMVVVSKEGTFAMIIENMNLFNTQAYKIWGAEQKKLAREYNNDLINKPQVIYDDVIKQVAKVLPAHGIGLYKASAGLNIWKKVVYNPITDKAEEVACN